MPRRTAPKCPARGGGADLLDINALEQMISGEVFFGSKILVTLDDWRQAVELRRDDLINAKRKTRSKLFVEKFLGITIERKPS